MLKRWCGTIFVISCKYNPSNFIKVTALNRFQELGKPNFLFNILIKACCKSLVRC